MDLQLAKLNRIEAEAWDAWHRSKQDRVTTGQSKDAGGQTSASVEKAGQIGDSRHLATALTCINRRCKLLDLDAPERRELSGPAGGPIQIGGSGLDEAHIDMLLREHYRGRGGN